MTWHCVGRPPVPTTRAVSVVNPAEKPQQCAGMTVYELEVRQAHGQ